MEASLHRFRLNATIVQDDEPIKNPTTSTESAIGSLPQAACARCRRLKRKCSRTLPRCHHCVKAESTCSFESLAHQIDAQTASIPHLQARIVWLEKCLSESQFATQETLTSPLDTTSTCALETPSPDSVPDAETLSFQSRPLHKRTLPKPQSAIVAGNETRNVTGRTLESNRRYESYQEIETQSPKENSIHRFGDAYFSHVHRMYPFLDRSKILEDLTLIDDVSSAGTDQVPMKLYLVMAIGCSTLRRLEHVSERVFAIFQFPYQSIVQNCLLQVDLETTDTLLLLALYSLFDPSDISPWVLSGILSRHVMTLGLGRTPSLELDPTLAERRIRLFWSVYCLDRLMAVSTGMPFGINDEKTNIALPSLTSAENERGSRDFSSRVLYINRHLINLRQLESKILQSVHFSKEFQEHRLASTNRHIWRQELRTEAENWYTEGVLRAPSESNELSYHSTIHWLSHRFQGLLIMLYAPSHFNSPISDDHFCELRSAMQKYIRISSILQKQRYLPLNWVAFSNIVSLCPMLLYCIFRTNGDNNQFKEEALSCALILDSFSEQWHGAKQGSLLLRKIADLSCSLDSDIVVREVRQLVVRYLGESSLWYGVIDAASEIIKEKTNPRSPTENPSLAFPEEILRTGYDSWIQYEDPQLQFC